MWSGKLFHNLGAATVSSTFTSLRNLKVQAVVTRTGGNRTRSRSVNHKTIKHVLGTESVQWLVHTEQSFECDSVGPRQRASAIQLTEEWRDMTWSRLLIYETSTFVLKLLKSLFSWRWVIYLATDFRGSSWGWEYLLQVQKRGAPYRKRHRSQRYN